MKRAVIALAVTLVALAAVPAALAKKVPTVPSITGAVFTTVDTHDPNYAAECKNGNPANNCNQYVAKQYVFLNGGPTKNHLSPDGVYFYAVLTPSGQSNANDGSAENLSDDYDCYKNREIVLTNGEVSAIQSSSDAGCFTSGTPFTHVFDKPFVQLAPYIDTPNPGGVYIMAVCYVGPAGTTALSAPVTPDLCKFDAFKVVADTTPPKCALISKSGTTISVSVEDTGAGLEDVDYTTSNATASFPQPLVVGATKAFYVNATKTDATQGATLKLVVTDVAGNQTVCDPLFGARKLSTSATVAAGGRTTLRNLRSDEGRLSLTTSSTKLRRAVVRVNGRTFAVVSLRPSAVFRLDLRSMLKPHRRNTVSISAAGTGGTLKIRVSNRG
jgi:hypothetical protein